MFRLKLILFKIIFYPRYRYYKWKKHLAGEQDWEVNEKAYQEYCDLVEPITTYVCAEIHLKYESWKSVCERMML